MWYFRVGAFIWAGRPGNTIGRAPRQIMDFFEEASRMQPLVDCDLVIRSSPNGIILPAGMATAVSIVTDNVNEWNRREVCERLEELAGHDAAGPDIRSATHRAIARLQSIELVSIARSNSMGTWFRWLTLILLIAVTAVQARSVVERLSEARTEITNVRTEITNAKTQIKDLDDAVKRGESGIANIKSEISMVKGEIVLLPRLEGIQNEVARATDEQSRKLMSLISEKSDGVKDAVGPIKMAVTMLEEKFAMNLQAETGKVKTRIAELENVVKGLPAQIISDLKKALPQNSPTRTNGGTRPSGMETP